MKPPRHYMKKTMRNCTALQIQNANSLRRNTAVLFSAIDSLF